MTSTGKAPGPAGAADLDAVVPFQVAPLDIRGRAVQLGPLLDDILHRHKYPEAVATLLAEVITLTILLGTSLKFEGKFIVQTQTDGPVSLLVVEFRTPQSVRAYAQFDRNRLKEIVGSGTFDQTALMGNGILAMTIDQGKHTNRYQGIVKLENSSLEEVARQYFRQSEQIPTEVRMAVAQTLIRSENGKPVHGWKAGGVLVQFLPESEDRMRQEDLHGGDIPEDAISSPYEVDDAWQEARSLMSTISDIELTDTETTPERLLYRLFHQHGVHAYQSTTLLDDCSCSWAKIRTVLASFTSEEIAESTVNGQIVVDCEFCNKNYQFDPKQFLVADK